jgi:hypothetical protein
VHLVRRYDLDGLHLDRIRYPELAVGGQTPTTGASIGYNPTSVQRFQRHHGLPKRGHPTRATPTGASGAATRSPRLSAASIWGRWPTTRP